MTRTYRVGAIGTAWAAQSPLPALSSFEGVELVSICSGRLERAKEAADKFGAASAHDDYKKMLASEKLDILYVGSPVDLHAPMVVAAAEAGCHVICEKPLGMNAQECTQMLEALDGRGLAHQVAFTMRRYPGPARIKQLIDEGVIGELRHANLNYWLAIPDAYRPPYGALNKAERGGGILNAMGVHYLDLLGWWFGDFARVSGELRINRTKIADAQGELREVTADDGFLLSGSLRNGATVSMHMSCEVCPGSGGRLELYGSEGSIVLDGTDDLRVCKKGEQALAKLEISEPSHAAAATACKSPRFGQLIHDLIQWIEKGERQPCNLEDGLRAQRVIDALREADRTRAVVELG